MKRVAIRGGFVLVDDEDEAILTNSLWHVNKDGYAMSGGGLFLHRELLGLPRKVADGIVCDHINRDRLDNRRSNLRRATALQNKANASLSRRNTSGHTGIYQVKRSGKWSAVIHVRGQRRRFDFQDKESAVDFRQLAQEMMHGEYAQVA